MKVTLNRCVFRRDLKFPSDAAFLIFAGNLFHKVGAATLNAQSPYDLSRDTGTYGQLYEMQQTGPEEQVLLAYLDQLTSSYNFSP